MIPTYRHPSQNFIAAVGSVDISWFKNFKSERILFGCSMTSTGNNYVHLKLFASHIKQMTLLPAKHFTY